LNTTLLKTGLRIEDDIDQAPNPKPTAIDKRRFGSLASLYTAFSVDFAEYALDLCQREGCSKILDPFSGMGTLVEAARTRPVRLTVSDISPFAALAGAFRAAAQEEIVASVSLFERLTKNSCEKDERVFYAELFASIPGISKLSISKVLARPRLPRHRSAALVIYLAALSRIRLYGRLVGSNPTWVKRPEGRADHASLREAVAATVKISLTYAKTLPRIHARNRTVSICSDITELEVAARSFDAIVTSPPYANRTDYIRHYLPATELLMTASEADERTLRAKQIGTPLIRAGQTDMPLIRSVNDLLEKIRTHKSYASERYYYKNFLYYFADMGRALASMRRWLRQDGLLILVVQDTYYKDVYVPTAELLVNMAEDIGMKLQGRKDWRVAHHLSSLSPHSRRTLSTRKNTESAIVLSR
jgi:DNA modification methylase